jgi:hypothetical protein
VRIFVVSRSKSLPLIAIGKYAFQWRKPRCCSDRLGSTKADQSPQKLYHPTGRVGGECCHSVLAAGEWPGSRALEALSHFRAPEVRSALAGHERTFGRKVAATRPNTERGDNRSSILGEKRPVTVRQNREEAVSHR